MSLYNEMRPSKWSEVKGQDNIVKVLKDNLSTKHIPNAMLFVGTRGTGKTTVAKIFAKSINCEHPLADGECCDECLSCQAIKNGTSIDVLELDAASNNGVDNIRDIIQQVQYKPVGKYKVVILDEVHMLSQGAFNALLKVMEEPPKNVIFILCTTELHKIPATILSRCRKCTFGTISSEKIIDKLKEINEKYGLTAEEGALRLVAKAAKGSMRDAESIYETFIDEKDGITETLVQETLGYSNDDTVFQILTSLTTGDPSAAFEALSRVVAKGGNLVFLLEECMRILLDIIFIQFGDDLSELSEDYLEKASEIAFGSTIGRLLEICKAFNGAYEKKGNGNFELTFQGVIVSLICEHSSINVLEKKVAALEKEVELLKSGVSISIPVSEASTMVGMEVDNDESGSESDEDIDMEPIDDYSFQEETSVVEEDMSSSEEESSQDGFESLSDEDLAELAKLGFSVAKSPKSEENTDEKTESEVEDTPADSAADIFFGDFARQFGEWF